MHPFNYDWNDTFWRRLSALSFLAITILLFFLFVSHSWRNSSFSNRWLWDSSEDLVISFLPLGIFSFFGSRIFWRTELLSFRRNARNVRRNLREHKEHLNCKQSWLLESVVEFTHFLDFLNFSPSLSCLLLYIVVLGFDFRAQSTCILC